MRNKEKNSKPRALVTGGAGFLGGTLIGRLYGNLLHDNEMYGTIVVYLRLKGIVPPSSTPPPAPAAASEKK